jgi:N-acetylglucosamine kinase-like BadF-type ATPase
VPAIAALTPLLLERAEQGDPDALSLVEAAAQALYAMLRDLQTTLDTLDLPIVFAGGLLSTENSLSRALCRLLALPQRLEGIGCGDHREGRCRCVSAAKVTTTSQPRIVSATIAGSQMSPFTNR